jgi:hypothetical protein
MHFEAVSNPSRQKIAGQQSTAKSFPWKGEEAEKSASSFL